MAEEISGIVNTLNLSTLGICNLFQPRQFQGKGELKYGATFVMPPTHPDFIIIKDRIVKLIKAKWPDLDIGAAVKNNQLLLPYQTGEKAVMKYHANLAKKNKPANDRLDWLKGNLVLKAASKAEYPPVLAVVLPTGGVSPALEGPALAAAKSKFYTGAEVLFGILLKAYDGVGEAGKPGVTAYLSTVVSTGKGQKRGGGIDPSQVFASYKGAVSNEDPTAGMSDEIPF
jgi:hypothetical protein